MPEDDEMMSGGEEGGGGGGVVDEGNLNDSCQFIDGQFVCTPPDGPSPEEVPPPIQTECPQCNQILPTPPSGTRGNYFWDSKKIIDNVTKPLNKKKKQ
jgi:hypothetical protein